MTLFCHFNFFPDKIKLIHFTKLFFAVQSHFRKLVSKDILLEILRCKKPRAGLQKMKSFQEAGGQGQ